MQCVYSAPGARYRIYVVQREYAYRTRIISESRIILFRSKKAVQSRKRRADRPAILIRRWASLDLRVTRRESPEADSDTCTRVSERFRSE